MTDIVERLRKDKWHVSGVDCEVAAQEIERLRADSAKLRTVMVAAAEEIHAHWGAHCDAEGYGPANLMRRLEEGIPSHYGYTAGDFERLRLDAARLDWIENQWRDGLHVEACAVGDGSTWHALRKQASVYVGNSEAYGDTIRAAIDAAMKA